MKQSYSTKELAKMWDVSESTVKRWADAGMLRCRKTAGGHRKFEIRDVVEFQGRCGLDKKGGGATRERCGFENEIERLLTESDFAGLSDLFKRTLYPHLSLVAPPPFLSRPQRP